MTTEIPASLLILAAGGPVMYRVSLRPQLQHFWRPLGQVGPRHPRVNQVHQREANQQSRIANGIKNDKLTPGQASRLENSGQRLENNEKKDMAKDNGHLARQDQRQANREASHMSARIAKDKKSSK